MSTTINRHEKVIAALREAAAFLETHPDVPRLGVCWLYADIDTKDELRAAARVLGSFEKQVTDNRYALVKAFGPLTLEVSIQRERVCKRIVTWECPEDLDSLLREASSDGLREVSIGEQVMGGEFDRETEGE